MWFNYGEIASGQTIFGINWRTPNSLTTSTEIPTPQEWDGIIGRTNMNNGVNAFYRVSVSGYANCLLLPPDETVEADLDGLTEGATITDYAKYLGKGFVLLMNTGRATYTTKLNWAEEDQGWYWTLWNNMSRNRTYFYWTTSSNPRVDWATNQFRMRVRLIKDE